MSYLKCPDCGKEIKLFGESNVGQIAEKHGYDLLARIPIDPTIAALVDGGRIEDVDTDCVDGAVEKIIEKTSNK